MSWFSDLFGSGDRETTTSTSMPDWMQQAGRTNYDLAQALTDLPYQRYGGTRVAPLSRGEQDAEQVVRAGLGRWTDYMDPAAAMTSAATGMVGNGIGAAPMVEARGYSGGAVNEFMNPYLDSVIGEINRQGRQQRGDIRAGATAARAFGGSRGELALAQQREAEARQTQAAQVAGFQNAQQMFQGQQAADLTAARANQQTAMQALIANLNDRANAANINLQAGRQMASLGQLGQGMNMNDAAALEALGRTQRGLDQAGSDADYNDWRAEIMWPYQQLQYRQAALGAAPYPQTQTSTAPGSPILPTLVGLGSGVASMGSAFDWW